MSSINGTTRITGIASGLDTDSIVKELMDASKTKIASVEKKKILLEWKREYYMETATNLNNFKQKYLNSTSGLFSDALTKLSVKTTSSLVTVTPTNYSSKSDIYIDDIVSLASSAKLTSSYTLSAHPPVEIVTENLTDVPETSMVIVLNGIEKKIKLPSRSYSSNTDLANELQAQLDSAFGKDNVKVDLSGNKMSLVAENSSLMIKNSSEPDGALLFEAYSSNRAEMNVAIRSAGLAESVGENDQFKFSINGISFDFNSSNTLNEIINSINKSDAGVIVSYSSLTDKLTMASKETGSSSAVSISDSEGSLMQKLFGEGVYTAGTDAIVRLSADGSKNEADFITIKRSSNTFDINGSTVTLNGKMSGETREAIDISIKIDTSQTVEKIKSFINDYNTLLSSITTKLSEEYNRNYLPLTSDEKAAMTEEEVKLWTEKAKSGLLQNDSYLNTISQQLRSIFYTPIKDGDGNIAGLLSDIGITTPDYSARGQISINETKLADALNNDPDKVFSLLTQKSSSSFSLFATDELKAKRFSENGILERLSDFVSVNLSKTLKKGALINLVGSPDDMFKGETDYSKRIKDLEDRISKMNVDLASEEERYWKQFTAMEKAISTLNQQSQWIGNMLANNSNK